jgi:hypothetical protein
VILARAMQAPLCGLVVPLLLVLDACAGAAQGVPAAPTTTVTAAEASPPRRLTREERCREAGRACGTAILSASDDRGLDCMADEVIAQFGGRPVLTAALAKVKAEMAADGVAIVGAEFDLPQQMAAGGNKLFAVVPQRVTMRLPNGHIRTHSYLLAISADDGQTWKFVDGAKLTREMLTSIFPAFPEALALPEVGKPERLP